MTKKEIRKLLKELLTNEFGTDFEKIITKERIDKVVDSIHEKPKADREQLVRNYVNGYIDQLKSIDNGFSSEIGQASLRVIETLIKSYAGERPDPQERNLSLVMGPTLVGEVDIPLPITVKDLINSIIDDMELDSKHLLNDELLNIQVTIDIKPKGHLSDSLAELEKSLLTESD